MQLTNENYHSRDANMEYLSNSQYQGFMTCEHQEMGKISGNIDKVKEEWDISEPIAFIEGSYLDAWNNKTLDQFKASRPELYKKDGELLAKYKHIEKIIEFLEKDKLFMDSLSGEKQKIFTAEMFGAKWKIAIDSYFPRDGKKEGRIVDLKYLKSLKDKFWKYTEDGILICEKTLEHRGYLDQIAIYCRIEQLASRPDKNVKNYPDYYEPFITVATKEGNVPDKEIISFNTEGQSYHEFIEYRLSLIEKNIERILAVKNGAVEPKRCGYCDYCKATKILTGTTHYSYFLD